ncbi:MAG: efflux RND transporter periplasmic adaptor subunit, partial [bacterium]
YMLIAVEGRYFWIAAILLMMIATHFFDLLFNLKKSFLHGAAAVMMLAAVMFSFCRTPADFLLHVKEITGGQIPGLRIYNLQERDHLAMPGGEIGLRKKPVVRIPALAPFSCCAGRLSPSATAQEAQWATVMRDTLRLELVESGEIEAVNSTIVEVPLIGNLDLQIIDIIPEGEQVDSGAVLVRLDPAILANTLEQERAELQAYRNELESLRTENELKMRELKHQVERAEYYLQLARIDLQVLQYGSGSRKKQGELEVLKAEIALKEARTNLKNGQVMQAPAEIQQQLKVALAQRTVNRLEQQMEQMTVRAPLAGMVVYLLDENGEKLQIGEKIRMGQGIINLPDLSRMQVKFRVNAMDVSKLQVGQKALVHLEAFPNKHFHAKLVSLSKIPALLEADSQVRVFEAIVEIAQTPQGGAVLKPGMTAKVNILLDEIPDTMLLPIRCVYEIAGLPVVFTEKSGAQPVPVKVGAGNNYYISVEGLEADTKVAWEPAANEAKPLRYAEFRRRQRRTMEDYDLFFSEMEKRRITFDYDAARRPAATPVNSTNGTNGAMKTLQK